MWPFKREKDYLIKTFKGDEHIWVRRPENVPYNIIEKLVEKDIDSWARDRRVEIIKIKRKRGIFTYPAVETYGMGGLGPPLSFSRPRVVYSPVFTVYYRKSKSKPRKPRGKCVPE
jgi:hypothetical protein